MQRAAAGPLRQKFRRIVLRRMAAVARHPLVAAVTGVALLVTGVVDLLEDLIEGFETALEAYHGVIALGVVTSMRGLADMVEGLEWLGKDAEAAEEMEELASTALGAGDDMAHQPRVDSQAMV